MSEIDDVDVYEVETRRLDSRIVDTKGEVCDILNAHFGRSAAADAHLFATSETERKVKSLHRRAQELSEAVEGVGADLTAGVQAKEAQRDELARKLGSSRLELELTEQLLLVHGCIVACDRCVVAGHALDAVDAIEAAQHSLDGVAGGGGGAEDAQQEQSPSNGDVASATAVRLLRREIRRRQTDLTATLGALWQRVVAVPTLDAASFARRAGGDDEDDVEYTDMHVPGVATAAAATATWSVTLLRIDALNRDTAACRAPPAASPGASPGGGASSSSSPSSSPPPSPLLLPRLLRALQRLSAATFRRHVESFARSLVARVVTPLLTRAERCEVALKIVARGSGRVDLLAICTPKKEPGSEGERGEGEDESDESDEDDEDATRAFLASPAQRIDVLEHSAAKEQTDLGAVLQLLRFVRKHILGGDDELSLALGSELFGASGASANSKPSPGARMRALRAASSASSASSAAIAPPTAALSTLLLSQMQALLPQGQCTAVALRELGRELSDAATRFEHEARAMRFGATVIADNQPDLNWFGLVKFAASVEEQYVASRRRSLLIDARALLTRGDRHESEWVGGLGSSESDGAAAAAQPGAGTSSALLQERSPFGSAQRVVVATHAALEGESGGIDGHACFPLSQVSTSALALKRLIDGTLEEARSAMATPRCAKMLYRTARDMIDLFRAVRGGAGKADVSAQAVPRLVALFHNDCMYLAHHAMSLGHRFCRHLPDPLCRTATFVDIVPPLRRLAEKELLRLLEEQQTELVERTFGTPVLPELDLLSKERLMVSADGEDEGWRQVEGRCKKLMVQVRRLRAAWAGQCCCLSLFGTLHSTLPTVLSPPLSFLLTPPTNPPTTHHTHPSPPDVLPWELYCHAMGHCLFEKLFAMLVARVTTLLEDNELKSPFELQRNLRLVLDVQKAFVPAPVRAARVDIAKMIPSWDALVGIIEAIN